MCAYADGLPCKWLPLSITAAGEVEHRADRNCLNYVRSGDSFMLARVRALRLSCALQICQKHQVPAAGAPGVAPERQAELRIRAADGVANSCARHGYTPEQVRNLILFKRNFRDPILLLTNTVCRLVVC